MSEHPLAQMEFSNRVAKRAQYEAFEFAVKSAGVRVRNASHAEPERHECVVAVSKGVPTACTCPADARFDGACRHRVAVAIRDPVVAAASRRVAADGGTVAVDGETELGVADEEECSDCLADFPCWECVRAGKEDMPG